MRAELGAVLTLAQLSVRDPRAASDVVLSHRYPRNIMWAGLFLVACLTVLMQAAVEIALPPAAQAATLQVTPFHYLLILMSCLVMLVFAIYFTGKAMGGQGTFPGAIGVVIWTQTMIILGQPVQLLAYLLSPALGQIVTFLVLAVVLRVITHLNNVLHGFDSLGKSALVLIAALIGIGLGLSLILSLIGVSVGMTLPGGIRDV